MEESNNDLNKVGHKYTEHYKQKVKEYFLSNNNNLDCTLAWVRQIYPKISRKVIRTWIDETYRKYINEIRDRNNRKWRTNHPEKYAELCERNNKNSVTRFRPERHAKTKAWRENNKEHLKEYHKRRWQLTKEKQLARKRERKRQDPVFKLLENTRTYIWQQLQKAFNKSSKEYVKNEATDKILGCTPQEYMNHLRSLYKPGMTDENYGKWHVDHIIPCSSFNLTDEIQFKQCFNYENTQPLWAEENLTKSDKII